jgi:glutamyl-tRNA synthetase
MSGSPGQHTTRLAPSPTGALHLGNVRTFAINWALARQLGWDVLLRIEDLDTPRVKAGAAESIADTLAWLGLTWSPWHGCAGGVLVQSCDLEPYRESMRALAHAGVVYPCLRTRHDLELAASAPQEGFRESVFPAALRDASAGARLDFDRVNRELTLEHPGGVNWRLIVPPGLTLVRDALRGEQFFNVAEIVGDFVVWTKRDQPAYQLAVVVDDARQGVSEVVRGDDLLDSAARQMLLQRLLRIVTPRYFHLPLVKGSDGKRLAKRHGDTRVESYRTLGVPAPAILGLVAHWSGITSKSGKREPMEAEEFAQRLALGTIPREPVTMSTEDHQWLLSNARR